jgi:hypothetical protein
MPRSHRLAVAALTALLLGSGLLRWFLGVNGPSLWLDEAWSVLIARACQGNPLAVFAESNRVDNNHPLMTLLMVLLGAWREGWVYRGAVWLMALPLVPLSYLLSRRLTGEANPLPGLLVALLAAASFAFTVYGTEARGYGIALSAAIAAWCLIASAGKSGEGRLLPVAYWVVCSAGVLAHFSFVQALGGLLLWHARSGSSLRDLVKFHAVPLVMTSALFFSFTLHMKVAGAGGIGSPDSPLTNWYPSLCGALSLLVGGPSAGGVATALGSLVLAGTLIVAWRHRTTGGYAVLGAYGVALGLVLGKAVLLGRGEVVFPRYFLIAATFGAVFTAAHLARHAALLAFPATRHRLLGASSLLLLLASLGANTVQTVQFATQGRRGEYLAPLQVVASSTEPTLGSDYDSRTLRLENYYRPWLPGAIAYQREPASAPQWYLLGAAAAGDAPPPTQTLQRYDAHYRLHSHYPHHGPSGWTWSLYTRE